MSHADIVNYMRRIKAKIGIAENFVKAKTDIEEYINRRGDAVGGLTHIDYEHATTVLILPSWENEWKYLDVLVHEITHMVHAILGKCLNMMDEDEARAYQTEFLFKEIRKKLYEHYP